MTTETCIMSQLDCSAGTSAEAFWSSFGSVRVAKATMPRARGEDQMVAMSARFAFGSCCCTCAAEAEDSSSETAK